MIYARASKASSCDHNEDTTDGYVVTVQLWRLVLDLFVTWRVGR